MPTCKKCNKDLPLSDFYLTHRGHPRGKCKSCLSEDVKARYDKTATPSNGRRSKMPGQEWLRNNFDYNDGQLIRKTSRGKYKAGTVAAGKLERGGYVRMGINCNMFLMHRIIWKWHHNSEPDFLDHIDHNRANNRIENLRELNRMSNTRNQVIPSNNTSGFIGVSLIKASGKWKAMIGVDYKDIVIGKFSNIKDAVVAYNKKAIEWHGEECRFKVDQNEAELRRRGLI